MLIEGKELTSQEMEEFNRISDIFLDTNNRNTSQDDSYYQKLNEQGINYITHGHNG
jgi:hypothetical protein